MYILNTTQDVFIILFINLYKLCYYAMAIQPVVCYNILLVLSCRTDFGDNEDAMIAFLAIIASF